MEEKQHVYIIGSKGIPAHYGGFETFVEQLTSHQVDKRIQYHVACMTENSEKSDISQKHFEYNHAKCFNIDVPKIGPARAIYYDVLALNFAIQLAKVNRDKHPIFYVLACRIGPFIGRMKKRIEALGGRLFVNPDGHEWLRAKWAYPVRRYWKHSERLMVKHADLLICDSQTIENYIQETYRSYEPETTYLAYGTDLEKSELDESDSEVREWYQENDVSLREYYLVVGRFVPENNYETAIREFMKSETTKDLVLITNNEQHGYYTKLRKETAFDSDPRIKFVGTVYNQELLKYIREHAFAYIHGHEVGGTNPSLLEAMALTKLNLLLDVGFNREVGRNSAVYWKKNGTLHQMITGLDSPLEELMTLKGLKKPEHIATEFSWETIVASYEDLLMKF
ncbi:beta 1-4 rhamnosyltransferase Cps2T [Enterococcus sp. AZ196]|uniref:beta 1-4 rhamnosyltransferase Cps2T n=1 Tax=Enterococcus sp. AZ196 TaxID=2774659 RepID=UPI003D2B97D7